MCRSWKSPRLCCTSWTPEAAKKRSVSPWVCKNKIWIVTRWLYWISNWIFAERWKQPRKKLESSFFLVSVDLNVWGQIKKKSRLFDYVPVFSKQQTSSTHNTTWREGRRTGSGNRVLPGGNRIFLTGDRQTKCLDGDRQRTVWCLEQDEIRYPSNRRTKCTLTVSYRRPGKLGSRSNSLSFCVVHATSHVSS